MANSKANQPKKSPRLTRLTKQTEGLTGLDKELMDDLLAEYDALASMVERLRRNVQDHGEMVDKEVGSVNNRHFETVENPEFTTYQKGIARLGDLAKKISDFNKRSDDDIERGEDEVAAFIRR